MALLSYQNNIQSRTITYTNIQIQIMLDFKPKQDPQNHQAQLLRKFGIRVPRALVPQTLATILADPQLSKQAQKIRSTLHTMISQDSFIQCITTSHRHIAQIPQNHKVIQNRQSTYSIRAINPQNIRSLTQRAFFNSFNLQRNVLNDLDQQTKLNKNTSYRVKQSKQRPQTASALNQPQNSTLNRRLQNQQQQKCICNKNIPGSQWIQCANEQKCRGSNWYHLECSGLEAKDMEMLKDINFTCQMCRREEMEEGESGGSQVRKRNKEGESGR